MRLTDVLPHTLHGDEIQLKTNDVLIGIGSGDDPVTPIFAPADAYVALHEHALDTENGGITNPLTFIVMRNGELLQVQSYYIFNPNFMWDDVSAGRAFLEGGADFLTLGLWPRLVGLFSSDPKAPWKTSQRLCRLKQFHPGATFAVQVATVVVPLPTKFLRIGRGDGSPRRLVHQLLKVSAWSYLGSLFTSTAPAFPHLKRNQPQTTI